jgi:hypothetical protein
MSTRHAPSYPVKLADLKPPFFLQIRIQGYKAVVQMSKEQPGWVERNVDVLVQLLQSGESSSDGENGTF